jgi:NitT/TauT family transport system substrate-binding protein
MTTIKTALRATTVLAFTLPAGLIAGAAGAQNVPVSFGTNWVAQAEHGGYYQAVADGTYAACGIDVTILPGGPQVNNRALMIAGQIDFHMSGSSLDGLSAVAEELPIVAVAASFQKEPQIIMTHPGAASSFEDLKNLDKILISDGGVLTFWAWMINAYGFDPAQREVYTFNMAPLVANDTWGMQGYLSSEPFFFQQETGVTPDVYLIADAGYTSYSTIIETMAGTIADKPEAVQCFVDGSAIGWYNFLYGDNSAAIELIQADNPEMSDEAIAYAIESMIANGIVDSGDTLELGIGAMTEAGWSGFYDKMVAAGVVAEGLDVSAAYTLDFVNKGVGLDLRPAE